MYRQVDVPHAIRAPLDTAIRGGIEGGVEVCELWVTKTQGRHRSWRGVDSSSTKCCATRSGSERAVRVALAICVLETLFVVITQVVSLSLDPILE